MNGQPREVTIQDILLLGTVPTRIKAIPSNPKQIPAPMPGLVSRVLVAKGDKVLAGQKLFTLEAMKMETTVCSSLDGTVSEVTLLAGTQVEMDDLIVRLD